MSEPGDKLPPYYNDRGPYNQEEIDAAVANARREALEEAAKLASDIAREWADTYQRVGSERFATGREACNDVALRIRALIGTAGGGA
jgi:hypothetical protein